MGRFSVLLLHGLKPRTPGLLRKYATQERKFQGIPSKKELELSLAKKLTRTEGDHVVLRPVKDPFGSGYLSKALASSSFIESHHGKINHSDIIGKRVRDIVTTPKGARFRIHEPTLAEYVSSTPRIVTPVSLYTYLHIYPRWLTIWVDLRSTCEPHRELVRPACRQHRRRKN